MVDIARPGERIPIASDHAGFELKERLRVVLGELGYEVEDIGTHSTASTDYPDYAHPLSQQVSDGAVDRGILLCGTGLGMSYVANRYPGVRAAVVWNPEIAGLARKHQGLGGGSRKTRTCRGRCGCRRDAGGKGGGGCGHGDCLCASLGPDQTGMLRMSSYALRTLFRI